LRWLINEWNLSDVNMEVLEILLQREGKYLEDRFNIFEIKNTNKII